MITISEVEETHFWCQSCYKKNDTDDVQLFNVSITLEEIEMAKPRLCQTCLDELQSKISIVLSEQTKSSGE